MQTAITPDVYTNFSSLMRLRGDARKDPETALHAVARQFESMYIRMMLKSMRKANFGDPLFNSNAGKMYQDMFDNQLAIDMSDHGGFGLAKMLVKQLQHYIPNQYKHAQNSPRAKSIDQMPVLLPQAAIKHTLLPQFKTHAQFVKKIWPLAKQAAKALNVPTKAIVAQAALETGWGQHINHSMNGVNSHNLFNIKADGAWKGPRVVVNTIEFDHGVAKRQKAAFRAYQSYADCFKDYVKFLKSNPRYREILTNVQSADDFAHKLHQAGYATDPRYADKLIDIMQRRDPGSDKSDVLASTQV